MKKTVFVLVTIALVLLAIEGAMRLVLPYLLPAQEYLIISSRTLGLGDAPLYQPHHYLVYTLTSNYQHPVYSTHHNSFGFRGPEVIMPKPPGQFRIACLGGSTTYSIFVRDDVFTYPAQLEKILRERHPDRDITVINAGVGGYTTAEMLLNYIFKVSELDVDAIVLYEGVNDTHPRIRPDWNRDYSGYRKIWHYETHWYDRLADYSLTLRYILYASDRLPVQQLYLYTTKPRFAALDAHYFSQTTSEYFAKNMRAIIDLARAQGVKVMLTSFASQHHANYFKKAGVEHNAVMTQLAQEYHLPLADVEGAFAGHQMAWMVDTVHANEKGAEVQARTVADAIDAAGWF